MKSVDTVRQAFVLRGQGWTTTAIASAVGAGRRTVAGWLAAGEDTILNGPYRARAGHVAHSRGPDRCRLQDDLPGPAYAYLLGQYLGDGWIDLKARRGVYKLAITCCVAYPNIVDECQHAIETILPTNRVGRVPRQGVIVVQSYSKHWPCLFPQCGPGPKHARPIVLEPWQEKTALVDHPEAFLRGLIHSDGWRGTNPVRSPNGKRYEYVRYQFSNRSDDILQLFARACESVGAEWKRMNRHNLSVNKRSSVELLDTFVGPKS